MNAINSNANVPIDVESNRETGWHNLLSVVCMTFFKRLKATNSNACTRRERFKPNFDFERADCVRWLRELSVTKMYACFSSFLLCVNQFLCTFPFLASPINCTLFEQPHNSVIPIALTALKHSLSDRTNCTFFFLCSRVCLETVWLSVFLPRQFFLHATIFTFTLSTMIFYLTEHCLRIYLFASFTNSSN